MTNFGRHCGFSLSAVNTAPWLQRAVGRHSPSNDGATGGPCRFCGAELRHIFVASGGANTAAAHGPEAAPFKGVKRLEADARLV
jgi:hypothetical protein